jgi:hypothetical protein
MWGWIVGVFQGLLDILHTVGDALLFALKWFVAHAWVVLRWLGDHIATLAGQVWHGLQKFWTEILPDFARKIAKIAETVSTFMKDHFGWLISAVGKITKAINFVYKNILQPLFQVIDVFRAIFRVLGDLGVGWAAKVDQWLGNLEAKIWSAFESVRGWLNHALGLFAWLLDPFGLIRRGHLLGAIGRDTQHLFSVVIRTQRAGHLGQSTSLALGATTTAKQRVNQFRSGELFDDPAVVAAVDSFDATIGLFFG